MNLRRLSAAALLGIALVLAQSLGLVHGVAHADHLLPEGGVAEAGLATPADLEHLFGGDAGGHDCQAFDHAVAGDGATPCHAVTTVATAAAVVVSPPRRSPILAAEAAGFLARGPPARL